MNKTKDIEHSEINIKILEHRKKIAVLIKNEIKFQKIPIEEIERQSISKTIIYNILQAKGYTINSLLKVMEVLKKNNNKFKITV